MGSLRHPIGPLPSSIYWRRRAVALAVLAALGLLAVWALSLGGGTGNQGQKTPGGSDGRNPSDPITPGPTDSVPSITDRPGGRDEVDGGAGSGGSVGGADGTGAGGTDGSGGTASGSAGSGSGGALAGSSGSVTGGDGVPAGPGVPDCSPDDVTVKVRSVENEYEPGDKPKVKLTLRNDGGADCRVDLGRTATVVTVTDAEGDRVWASDDCPPSRAAAWVEVPGGGASVHTLTWDRERSKPGCATPSAKEVPPGTYLVEVKVAGLSTEQTSFALAKD